MMNKFKSFIFEGCRIEGASEELLSGDFLNAGENLLMMGQPGLGTMELARIISRNAGKDWMDTMSSSSGFYTPPEMYSLMRAPGVLIIGGFPDAQLTRVIVERTAVRRPTIVTIRLNAEPELLTERFLTAMSVGSKVGKYAEQADRYGLPISGFGCCYYFMSDGHP